MVKFQEIRATVMTYDKFERSRVRGLQKQFCVHINKSVKEQLVQNSNTMKGFMANMFSFSNIQDEVNVQVFDAVGFKLCSPTISTNTDSHVVVVFFVLFCFFKQVNKGHSALCGIDVLILYL